MSPLPDTNSGAKIALYAVPITFVVLEQRVRLRSWRNQQESRADRGSLLVVIVSIVGNVGGGFAVAVDVQSASIDVARWPASRSGRWSTVSASPTAASRRAGHASFPASGEALRVSAA
ncbi:MAG TPA: hypothetical protein VIK04_04495 [Solirubrobacteraceae bacterium]